MSDHNWQPIGGLADNPVGFHCDHCDQDLEVRKSVPLSQRFKLANRDIEEAVAMMDHPPVHRSCFILGMQLAMRIVRNRIEDLKKQGAPEDLQNECENMIGMIRIVQIQIGSGRSEIPDVWTDEEIDEVRRIS